MRYKIYSQAGIEKLEFAPSSNSTHTQQVMADNVLNLTFTLPTFVDLDVNDYITIDGVIFTLLESYKPVIKSTVQYEYSIKMYGPESIAKKAAYVDANYEPITSIYDTPTAQLLSIVNGINRIIGSNRYHVGAVLSVDALLVNYSGTTCLEALNALAEATGTEWWLDGTNFNLTKCERGTQVQLGYASGLISLDKQLNDDNSFFTRLIPLGSTKNILPASYGFNRLQLPSGAKYVEQNVNAYGVVEKVEEDAFTDIFPRFEGSVAVVRTATRTIEEIERTIYYFTDPTLTFNPNDYMIAGLVKHLIFKSGDLNGQDFEANWNNTTHEWELINQYPTEGTQLPGDNLIPRNGDDYTIYNIAMPTSYITAASAELLQAVNSYLQQHSIDFSVYKASTDHVYLEDNAITLQIGSRVKLLSSEYFPSGSRDSRITKITRKLTDLGCMEIEISNTVMKSSYSKLQNEITNIRTTLNQQLANEIVNIIRSYQTGDMTDDNVLSSLRTLSEINKAIGVKAISKIVADTAAEKITFNKGLQVGANFVPGVAGTGGYIDGAGNGELKSLKINESLEVPELRYNRIEINVGDKWNSPGGGIIKSVMPDYVNGIIQMTGTITLKLEAGEIGNIALEDKCMGVFHNFGDPTANAIADLDDSKGNRTVKGFFTSYFRVIEITGANNSAFRYALRPDYTTQHHPAAEMNFVVYSNNEDTNRQTSSYETRTYIRHLCRMTEWEINASNIAAQYGDLSNLSVHGLNMSGYSVYLNNIYMNGTIQQFLDAPVLMEIDFSQGSYLAVGESGTITLTIRKGWEDITSTMKQWRWTRDTADPAADESWKIAHAGNTSTGTLSYEDLGNNAFTTLSTVFSFWCSDEQGTVVNGSLTI